MSNSGLVRLLGFRATLIHGDTSVLDRWMWLRRKLPMTRNGESLLDVGCGSGAFTIGAALRGYQAIGLTWDERGQRVASHRARLCNASQAEFVLQDVRKLDEKAELQNKFDFVICAENIEHVLDDRKLMIDMFRCLRPGGRLLLTTPNYFYREISLGDRGPFEEVESGWHVRRGYSKGMLVELCSAAGFMVEEIEFCTGFLSQKIAALWRKLSKRPKLCFALTLPLRVLPPVFDGMLRRLTHWPDFSICLVAYKPRW